MRSLNSASEVREFLVKPEMAEVRTTCVHAASGAQPDRGEVPALNRRQPHP